MLGIQAGLVLLGVLSFSCAGVIEGEMGPSGAGSTDANGAVPEQVSFGACAACHGATGEGTALGYELRHPVRAYASWVVRNGRTGPEFQNSAMAAYNAQVLNDAALAEIFDFLAGFPQPTTGAGLYEDYCRNCHGVDARGGAVGVDISDKEFNDARESVRKGAGADFAARDAYMPSFDTATLSDAEVRSITDYIASL